MMNTNDCNCKTFSTISEYPCKQAACIKPKKPDCLATAVIPAITVDTTDGITNLANCLVHVTSNNTTYYVDDKHRIMLVWTGPVEIEDYDIDDNPLGLRSQTLYTDKDSALTEVYFDKQGVPTQLSTDVSAITERLSELSEEIDSKADIVMVASIFENVDDMKSATDIVDGSYVRTLGFYNKGDEGGALYKVRTIESGESANEQNLIALTGNLVAELVIMSNMNVKQFGAHGDGETNDSSAINNAITALSGKSINIPVGTYMLNAPINVPANTQIVGSGADTVLKAISAINLNDNLIKLEGANNAALSNFTVDGNRSNQDESTYTQYGVYVSSSENVTLDGLTVKYANGVGIQVYNSRYCNIRNCDSSHNRYHAFECEQCQDCVFESSYGHDNDRHGIFVSPGEVGGTGSINNVITGCTFNDNGQYGVALGIDAQGISIGLTRNNIISNCVIHNNGYYGVSIYRVDRTSVIGCDINGNGAFGIQIYRAKENLIIGNRLQDDGHLNRGGYSEIMLEGYNDGGAALNNMINNNIFLPGNASYAIAEGSSGDGPNVVVNNFVYANGLSGKYNLQNPNTYFDEADVNVADKKSSYRAFSGGLSVVNNSGSLPSGAFGLDSPFNNVLRVYNDAGDNQIVTTNGGTSFYAGGNNTFNVNSDGANLNGHSLTNYLDLGGWLANVPASSSADGVAGMRAYDNDYLYVCVATNTWKRVALSNF